MGRGQQEEAALPMRLFNDGTLPPQLFLGAKMPQPELMRPVENFAADAYLAKPGGGLWTSSYRNGDSDWQRFAEQIGHRSLDAERWLLTPTRCRVCTIRSEADYRELLERYPLVGEHTVWLPPHLFPLLDWEQLAEQCDVIWLPEGRRHMPPESPFYGWDVESAFWMRWSFDQVESLDS